MILINQKIIVELNNFLKKADFGIFLNTKKQLSVRCNNNYKCKPARKNCRDKVMADI